MKEKNSILVADDDLAHRTMLRKLLSDWGYAVEEADDGGTAVLAAQRQPFDLILMDIRMPKLDGLAATRAIRRLPAMAQVPIVAVTASAFAGDRQRCLAAGMNDHLPKPVDPDRLRAVLQRWLPQPLQ